MERLLRKPLSISFLGFEPQPIGGSLVGQVTPERDAPMEDT